MNILIFGSNGRLGRELVERLKSDHQVKALIRSDCDLLYFPNKAGELVVNHYPDVVINASAKNGLEACQKRAFDAFQVNTAALAAMALGAKLCGAMFISFSTDYVFSGDPLGLYEDTPTKPWGVYGRTKLWGEEAIALCTDNYLVFRLSSLYGRDFAGVLQPIKQVDNGAGTISNPVKVLHQYATPTSTKVVADAVSYILDKYSRKDWSRLRGVYHLATKAQGLTKVKFTERLLTSYFGASPNNGAWHITEGKLPEPRPIYMELRSDKFEQTFDYKLPTWDTALEEFLPLITQSGRIP
jgi:dTDP-4-dehydrorhamnose reductase